MNSAKMVLDASLLEATFCTMQCTVGYSTVGLGVFFTALRGGELFSLFRFNFREETWSTVNSGMYFKRVHHRTKLTSVCRDTYSSLIASQDVKPNCTKQSDVKKRKTKKTRQYVLQENQRTAELHSHFSCEPDFVHRVSGRNNPEIWNFTRCSRVSSPPWSQKGIVWGEKILILFSLMCSDDTVIHLTGTKMRNANWWGMCPLQILPNKFWGRRKKKDCSGK